MRKRYSILALFFLLGSVSYAEPSVYGDGNSFSSVDKVVGKNKKSIMLLRRKILEQKEQIEGLKSIVEGLSATVHELERTVRSGGGADSNSGSADNSLLRELGEMIDKINSNYVTKEELKNSMIHSSPSIKSEIKPVDKNVVDNAQVYSEGVRLFVKHRYDEAKKRFITTDNKGYKTAPSNYYLGEISYYTKKYEDAIFYYKKSAGLNDKASYVDTLLLHTAISLEKRGKGEQAKVFYENIVTNYEGKKTAEIAKEKLKKF